MGAAGSKMLTYGAAAGVLEIVLARRNIRVLERASGVLRLLLAIKAFAVVLAVMRWFGFYRRMNKAVKGPGYFGSMGFFYNAGLKEYGGLNGNLMHALHTKYGKIAKFWLGPVCCVSFSDPKDIVEVQKKVRGRGEMTKMLLPYLGAKNLLFQPTADDNGKFVKQLRLKYGKMVNGVETQEAIHTAVIRVLEDKTQHWGEGKPIVPYDELKTLLYDVMGQVLFGGAWTDHDAGKEVYRVHRACIKYAPQLGMAFYKDPTVVNFLRMPFDFMAYGSNMKKFQSLCWGMIQHRRVEIQKNPAKWEKDETALTMLCKERTRDGSKPFFDKELASATCAGFLNGAYDTTLVTLFWALYHLGKHHIVQDELAAELAVFQGSEAWTSSRLHKLPYLAGFIQESMRHRPTVPLNQRTSFNGSATIGGVVVPEGVDIWLAHQEAFKSTECFGDDIEAFRPDRFIGDSPAAKKARSTFLGFGNGYRMCVGFRFAEAELKAALAYLVAKYEIRLADPQAPPPGMVFEAGVNTPREKVRLVFRPRA